MFGGGQAWDRNGAPCASGSGHSLHSGALSAKGRKTNAEAVGLTTLRRTPLIGDGAILRLYLWFWAPERRDPSRSCQRRLKHLSSILRTIWAGFLTGVESQNHTALSSGQCAKSTREASEEHPTVGRRVCKHCPQPVVLRASTKKPPQATGSQLPTHPCGNSPE